MKWPWVSRERFEETKQELVALKLEHARVLDEIVYRSTQFHLDPRFEKPNPPAQVSRAAEPADAALDPMSRALANAGPRMTAVRRQLEAENEIDFQAKQHRVDEALKEERRIQAARAMEEALNAGTTRAQTAKAS